MPTIRLDEKDNDVDIVESHGNKKLISSEHMTFDESSFFALNALERTSADESGSFSRNDYFTETEEIEIIVSKNQGADGQGNTVVTKNSDTKLDRAITSSSTQAQKLIQVETGIEILQRTKRKVKLSEKKET